MAEDKKETTEEKPKRARKKPAAKKPEVVQKAPEHKPEAPEAKAEAPVTAEPAKAAPARKAPKARKAAKTSRKVFVARGKRKRSIARATITSGKGAIRFNHMALSGLNNKYVREIIREPLRYVGPEANNVDIAVSVHGGGTMGQAQAARTAIARALMMYFEEMNLKDKFVEIDRSLIIEDTRRVESKKYSGPKARARYQKSYR